MQRDDGSRVRARGAAWFDSGWVGTDPEDDLDTRLAAETESFAEGMPRVLTTLGPIAPDALGVTLVGGWNRPLVAADGDLGAVLHELEHLHAMGLRSLVDLGSSATADSMADLSWISARTPVHVIAGREGPAKLSEAEAMSPRFGVAAIGAPEALHQIERLARNVPLFVAGSIIRSGEDWALLQRAAVEYSRLTVVVCATALVAAWEPALAAGAWVALIVPAASTGEILETVAVAVRDVVRRGFGDQILLGYQHDPALVMERLPIALMEAGLDAIEVRALFVDNPAGALTVEPTARSRPARLNDESRHGARGSAVTRTGASEGR